ncbi:MAG: glycosyltransferase family 2 protein [Desulfomonilia bacterium]|jgi:dolichol-phosphate mannosyltransferase
MIVKTISLVVPCYNETHTIPAFYKRVVALAELMSRQSFEFIFVNDGSTDGTDRILNDLALKDQRVKILHLAKNRGQQIALIAGMDFATGEMIVTIDADLQDPPELITEMMKKIEDGYDVVHAQRRHRSGETWFRLATAKLYYRILKMLSQLPIIDECSEFRAFSRAVLLAVSEFRTSHRFLRGTFIQVGFRQCIIQYDRDPRYAGYSKYPFCKLMDLAIDGILSFSSVPIRIITWLSIILCTCVLIQLLAVLYEHSFLHSAINIWSLIIATMFFFTGLILFILFSIAIIALYIGRIFQQGQNQPLYWIYETRNIDIACISEKALELREVRLSQQIMKENNCDRS